MRFFEVDSAVDAIMSAAMIAHNRASRMDKQGKLSMNGFLQMLANAGIMMDYEGFKTVFDTNPQLANLIAKFDKDSITFASDADDEGAGYEEPQGDMPDDERVAKMAKRAMRTREFVEEGDLPPHLAKMFGKDGKQVDTRTDVMKQMRDIVANKQAAKVEFGDGSQMIDMFTASVLTQVYDQVNDNSKEAIIQRIGTIEKFSKLMPKLFKMIGESLGEGFYMDRARKMAKMKPLPGAKFRPTYREAKLSLTGGPDVLNLPIRYHVVVSPGAVIAGVFDTREEAQKLELEMEKRHGRRASIVPLKTKKYKVFDVLDPKDEDKLSDVDFYSSVGRLAALQHIRDAERSGGKYPTLSPEEWQGYAIAAGLDPNKVPDKIMLQQESVQERKLTKAEKEKRSEYGDKLPDADFKERYGSRWKEVKYATATKMAKKNA